MWIKAFAPPLAYACAVRLATPSRCAWMLRVRDAHNLLLAAFSASVFVVTAAGMARRVRGLHDVVCQTPTTSSGLWVAWYWSKLWEWGDTALLVASGRPVSSLHYNHHMSTATLVALQTWGGRRVPTPLADLGMGLNAFVHTLMYLYYWRPRWLAPVRNAITVVQIAQHGTMITGAGYALLQADGDCDVGVVPYAAALGLYSMYLVQFCRFYARRKAKAE